MVTLKIFPPAPRSAMMDYFSLPPLLAAPSLSSLLSLSDTIDHTVDSDRPRFDKLNIADGQEHASIHHSADAAVQVPPARPVPHIAHTWP